MPGILNYNLSDYQNSATTYRSDLLRLPILGLSPLLAYMTLRPGVRHEEVVGSTEIDIELQPYVRNARQDKNLELTLRSLKTFFGTVNADFEPNAAISTLLGHRASVASGDNLITTPQAHEVLALTPKAIGRKLLAHMFDAKRDATGHTTKDLFNGFDTITDAEIAAGNISAAKGNYHLLSAKPSKLNAVDLVHEILEAMSPELRGEEAYIYCPQSFVDAYNRAYKLETGAAPYNTQYDQNTVEGSNGLLKFVPTVAKAGSKYLTISTKGNMLVGCDQMSDSESVNVGCFEPDTFTVMMRMFFGTQFESIDPRRLLIVEIPDDKDPKPVGPPEQTENNNENDNNSND